MPNWCMTEYAITGDEQEVKALYELMTELDEREEPLVKSDFGTTWLGCLVQALGGNWEEVRCRGSWNNLEFFDDYLSFMTETAWVPCNETFDLIRKRFPSLEYYYQAEEPGYNLYETNDMEGVFFPDRFSVRAYTKEKGCHYTDFPTIAAAYQWLEEKFECPVKSKQDVDALHERCKEDGGYCHVIEFVCENESNASD